ncbi:GNAT family N-acetyltransferase [Legionella bononiensis]|uniref:GNAT family N-acetyltransferase n=1 Tax=Legionella bononiensis TaxID=2793102 RepID=A0ABS1WDL0_9GAMM|nr:GNAT family N-acetyltransferase [Legionella bononiensis]MBL7481408.1 GNAT family N-acetyltransferase [Legionella bononiensis]MBL7527440.1 GNAT family N-acetyltransferase [Legionella bononiensis]
MSPNIKIRQFKKEEITVIFDAFSKANWFKPISIFDNYFREQTKNTRLVWVAYVDNDLAGYVTLSWKSKYEFFSKSEIPEIMDLNVLPQFRNIGIGNLLLDQAEKAASERNEKVGIGVGLYAGSDGGYGAAQKIYVKRGYVPDGKGVTYRYKYVEPGNSYPVDDDLVLWLTKVLGLYGFHYRF